ncbi:MAG TPA: hypothetical protein VGY58_15215, partial [Gemmataceae bacterium]|nr:hypothetical protein [Gemmataceae bacterium]
MRFRIAIVSTPRSGNTWLRHLLMHVYDMPGLAVHSPAELDWARLPERCVLQLHWPPTPYFRELLARHGVRPLALCRHPFDVLISILHFTLHDASTHRWLDGEGGDERSILGAMPRSAAFQEYAVGPRAHALLTVSGSWWTNPECCHVRYEDLLRDAPEVIRRLVSDLSEPPVYTPETAAQETTIPRLRSLLQHQAHFWQGRAGLWKELLPALEAGALAERLQPFVAPLGYGCDPNVVLTANKADANWIKLAGFEAAQTLRRARGLEERLADAQRSRQCQQEQLQSAQQALQAADRQLQERQAQIARVHRDLDAALRELQTTRTALARTREDTAALRAQLIPFLDF